MKKPEKQSFAVIGLGKFGSHVAMELAAAGASVLAVDINEERVADIAEYVTYAVRADVCDSKAIQALGISNMDAVIVAITGSLDASIMATILAKEAGVKLVIAKAKEEMHAKILKKTGADRVIIPERESGIRVAHNILAGNFLEFIEISQRVRMVEVEIKPEWVGKTLRELKLRNKYQVNVIALKESMDSDVMMNIDPDMKLKEGMSLWLVVDKNNVERLL
ncbi:MAG: TrkA family potassium uptake protein [Lachnospiraceae bacterium]|nr:TrkA family potassium uptake protein [Lachnospiraceae bacterium]